MLSPEAEVWKQRDTLPKNRGMRIQRVQEKETGDTPLKNRGMRIQTV
jgi:hypothetical protein